MRINLSETVERQLRAALRVELEQRWLEENRAAIDAYNVRVEQQGILSDEAAI